MQWLLFFGVDCSHRISIPAFYSHVNESHESYSFPCNINIYFNLEHHLWWRPLDVWKSSTAQWSLHPACERGSLATFVVQSSDEWPKLFRAPSCFGRHVKLSARLHLQLLASISVSMRVDVRQAVIKIIGESLSQHDKKHVVPTPISEIRVGKRKNLV
jgi:hypothetical protein